VDKAATAVAGCKIDGDQSMPVHPFIRFREAQIPPWSQAKLARQLGCTRSCVNRIEMGTRQSGIDLLLKAARVTKLPPAVLRPDLRAILKRQKRIEQQLGMLK
jgi:DNA-binding XRE family transcriptional regulator